MKPIKPLPIVNLVIIAALLALTGTAAHSRWTVNYSDIAFDGSGETAAVLESDIATGAGYFLEAYAETLLLMKKLEIPGAEGMKDDTLPVLASQALTHLEQARAAYLRLKQTAAAAPYNPAVLEALARFDYDTLQETGNLDKEILAEVKSYLSSGQIRELYGEIITRHEILIPLLKQIKSDIDSGIFPTLQDVWQANQVFARTLLFGQYVSRVFAAINPTTPGDIVSLAPPAARGSFEKPPLDPTKPLVSCRFFLKSLVLAARGA
jgi:hypothetical protein